MDSIGSYVMREPCKYCGCLDGHVDERNGQACVFCSGCGKHVYNAPKHERGLKPKPLRIDNISPTERYRVIERAGYRCEFCGRDPRTDANVVMHVEHLVTQQDVMRYEYFPPDLVNHFDNLAWLCEDCNLGKKALSLSDHQLLIWILRRKMKEAQDGNSNGPRK